MIENNIGNMFVNVIISKADGLGIRYRIAIKWYTLYTFTVCNTTLNLSEFSLEKCSVQIQV